MSKTSKKKELELERDELMCLLKKVTEPLLTKPYKDDPKLADKEKLTVPEFLSLLGERIQQEIAADPEYYQNEDE
jgi:hypothetical protein